MSFPKYLEYSNTNEHWLGAIPSAWKLRRLGYYFAERREKVNDREFPPLSVTKDGVVPQLDTAAKTDDNDNRKRVCQGDFVINSRSDRKGSSGISALDGSVSLINTVLTPSAEIVSRYAHYLLRSVPFQEEYYRFGKGIVADLWSTNYSEMRNILIPCPGLNEQQAIASFLDRETGKIDALVAEQRRLIELLKEKRQAVISHAVTKGLDPNAKMKPSGIEWLGDVPEHWNIKRIKHVATGFMYGTSEDCNLDDSGTPVLRIPNVKEGFVDLTDLKFANFSPQEEKRYLVSDGDILVVRTNGNPDLVGKSALFRGGAKCMFASYLIKIRPLQCVRPEFLNLVMNASCTREMLTLTARTSAGNYNMNCEGLGQTHLVLPSLREQDKILGNLIGSLVKLDDLTLEAQQAIELLQERRTALISAAVTGKIDVRHLASQEAA